MTNRCYFAYGSNLNLSDWEQFCQKCGAGQGLLKFRATAYLPDHELAFTYRSRSREGGVLDLRPRPGQAVAGALFDVAAEGGQVLDRKEGVAAGCYERMEAVAINDMGVEVPVTTYRVVADRRESFVQPSETYLRIVRDGLDLHGLPCDALDAAARNEPTPWLTDGLFVYGTLMRGESRFTMLKRFGVQCALLAHAHGELVDLGEFPGLIGLAITQTLVEGEFIRLRDFGGAVRELDRIEGFRGFGKAGSLFSRTLVSVDVGDGRIRRAWTYRYADEAGCAKAIASKSWRDRCGRREQFFKALVVEHVDADELAVARSIAATIPFAFGGDTEATALELVPLHAALMRGEVSERRLAQASGQWTAAT